MSDEWGSLAWLHFFPAVVAHMTASSNFVKERLDDYEVVP